jgi:hypothetical protein
MSQRIELRIRVVAWACRSETLPHVNETLTHEEDAWRRHPRESRSRCREPSRSHGRLRVRFASQGAELQAYKEDRLAVLLMVGVVD